MLNGGTDYPGEIEHLDLFFRLGAELENLVDTSALGLSDHKGVQER
jgi:hypothetical protein